MINHNKAYILGLLVGNGTVSKDTFLIKLPFRKWGMQPEKMNKIATDILTKICDKFQKNYNFPVSYEIGNSQWIIKPIGNPDISELITDLSELGLPQSGFLLDNVSLFVAKKKLKGVNIENFLSGIFDTRASLTKSHRRFTNEAPIVSLEIPGSTKNFDFVVSLCSWLNELGTTTDQILFNHPCQHSASDPTYKGWKKGFKIRFLVNSFIAKHSFALKAKAIDIEKLKEMQEKKEQVTCKNRKLRKPSPVSIHNDINSNSLPSKVKGKIFFHYHHYCAVLGCRYAPVQEVQKLVNNYTDYIFVLPRLEKGTISEIETLFNKINSKYLKDRKIKQEEQIVKNIINDEFFQKYLELEQGLAYLFSKKLNGKRHSGVKDKIIKENNNQKITIKKAENTVLPPLFISNGINDRAILISAITSELNQQLIKKHITVDKLEIIYK
ncbi:MAG: hypothetical protein DRI94_07475 [Bacteroidetes bacterium]|nr:MAG: hypothetical protein DRI94_07475 [Bacteroidota bacterium]